MSDHYKLWEEYWYVARKRQLRYPSPVMGYMLLFMHGSTDMFDARMVALKRFDEA
jgi:hypothetical protein